MATLTVPEQIEVVRKKALPNWRKMPFNLLLDFIKKGEVEKIGERDHRIPSKTSAGGRDGTYDVQGGDMGRGTMPEYNVMTHTYYAMRMNWEFDKLSLKATATKATAIENPLVKTMTEGFAEFQRVRDQYYHTSGNATLVQATAHSASSGVSVYTADTTFGTQLVRRGQYVTVYNTGQTSLLAVARITGVNTGANTVTLNIVVPGAAATDKLCIDGSFGASPTGPRGLGYWISSATTGTTAGVNRANESQIISKRIDGGSNPFSVEHVMGLYDQILMDRGAVADKLIGVCSPNQRAAAYNQVMSIQQIMLTGPTAEMVDRLPPLKGRKSFNYGDIVHYPDIHHHKTVVNYIIPEQWGRGVLAEEDYFETDGKSGSDARMIQIYGASGGPAAATWMGLTCEENPYTIDPGAQGLIDTLATPAYH